MPAAGTFSPAPRHSPLNAQVPRARAGRGAVRWPRRPRRGIAQDTVRLAATSAAVVRAIAISGSKEIAEQRHPRRARPENRRNPCPTRPTTSPAQSSACYRDEGYTFARVDGRVRRCVRRADGDDRRRRHRRRRVPGGRREAGAPVHRRVRAAGGRRLQPAPRAAGARRRCCGRRAARSVRARLVSSRPSPKAANSARSAAPSISSIATASASCWSACASRRAASSSCRISANARTGSPPVDGFVPSLGMGIARLRPRALQPCVRRRPHLATRPRRSAPATPSASSDRSSASRSSMSAASCTT